MDMKADETIKHCVSDGHVILLQPLVHRRPSRDQTVGLLAAQVMRAAMMHPLRRGDRDIKSGMKHATTLPTASSKKQTLFFRRTSKSIQKYTDMVAEHIYTLLPDNPKGGKGQGQGQGQVKAKGIKAKVLKATTPTAV